MWFNLHDIKKVIERQKKLEFRRSFIFTDKIKLDWKINTLFFKHRFLKRDRFAFKMKTFLKDQNNYFFIKKSELNLIESFYKYKYNKMSYFYCLLLFTTVEPLIIKKCEYILNHEKLLNKK